MKKLLTPEQLPPAIAAHVTVRFIADWQERDYLVTPLILARLEALPAAQRFDGAYVFSSSVAFEEWVRGAE